MLRYWLPPALWMAFIFWGSTDALSSRRTSRIIGPLLRWIHPGVREETIRSVQMVVRKTGHVTEFAVLALLFWHALYRPERTCRRPWSRLAAAAAFGLAVVYAATDEFHQSFVPSRDGTVRDVGFDAAGAFLGLLCLWWWGRVRGWWGRGTEGGPSGCSLGLDSRNAPR